MTMILTIGLRFRWGGDRGKTERVSCIITRVLGFFEVLSSGTIFQHAVLCPVGFE